MRFGHAIHMFHNHIQVWLHSGSRMPPGSDQTAIVYGWILPHLPKDGSLGRLARAQLDSHDHQSLKSGGEL